MSIQCLTFTRVLRLRLKHKHARAGRALREQAHGRDVNAAKNIAAWGLLGVEARVSAARLERDAEQAKALERKTKLAVNKAAKAAAAGHGRPVEGIPVLSRVSGQPLG